jgi:hypothetical protein
MYVYTLRAAVRAKRVRLENQRAYTRSQWVRSAMGVLLPWKNFVFASRIQRFVRCLHAFWKLRRLKSIKRNVMLFQRSLRVKRNEKLFYRWKKFLFLTAREKYRAAKRMVAFFRRSYQRSMLSKTCLRKIRTATFLYNLHKTTAKYFFHRLKSGSVMQWRSDIVTRMVRAMDRIWSRRGFNRWKLATARQAIVARWLLQQVGEKVRKKFFPHADQSVAIAKKKSPIPGSKVLLDPAPQPWEKITPMRKVLLSEDSLVVGKAFKVMMASYRMRNRYLIGRHAAKKALTFARSLILSLALRRLAGFVYALHLPRTCAPPFSHINILLLPLLHSTYIATVLSMDSRSASLERSGAADASAGGSNCSTTWPVGAPAGEERGEGGPAQGSRPAGAAGLRPESARRAGIEEAARLPTVCGAAGAEAELLGDAALYSA